MATVSGSDLRIWTDGDGVAIGYATSCTLDIQMAVTEVLHKDSQGNWTDNDPSTQSWSMSTDGFISEDDSINGENRRDILWLRTQIRNRTKLYLQWSTDAAGSATMEGYAYLTSLSETGAVGETATYSATFTGTGALLNGTET